MAFTEVPLVDNLGPYLDSLLEELSKKDSTIHETENGKETVATQTEMAEELADYQNREPSRQISVVEIDDTGDNCEDLPSAQEPERETSQYGCLSSSSFYLKDHLTLMSYFALYRWKGAGGFKDSICPGITLLLVSTLALVQSLGVFKDYVLGYAQGGSVFHYITAWYFFHTFVVSCCFLKLLVIGDGIPALIENIKNLLEEGRKSNEHIILHKKTSKIVIAAAIISIISAFLFAFEIFFINYDFNQIIEVRSIDLSKVMFLWTRSNYSEREAELSEAYGGINWLSVTLGSIGILIQFVGWLQYFMIKDIMLTAALTLYSHSEVYKAYISSIKGLSLNCLGTIWKNYELLHKISSEIETCFGKLFQLIHIDNWLFCAYFLYMYVDPTEIEPIGFAVNLVAVLKIAVMYCLSAKANNVAAQTRCRLHMKSSHIGKEEDTILKQDILYMEQKMKTAPVGIGSGNFLVHENFPYKFMGSVASSFLFFMKSENE